MIWIIAIGTCVLIVDILLTSYKISLLRRVQKAVATSRDAYETVKMMAEGREVPAYVPLALPPLPNSTDDIVNLIIAAGLIENTLPPEQAEVINRLRGAVVMYRDYGGQAIKELHNRSKDGDPHWEAERGTVN